MQARDDERGEILPLLILWPAVIVLLLVLAAQAFLATGARARAEAAASAGLRAAWAAAGDAGLAHADDGSLYAGTDPHRATALMTEAARDAVAHAAAGDSAGWRWWTSGATAVSSDWCHSGAQAGNRPGAGEMGWIRVEVTGEVIGPFSALWPGRLDTVHASAAGPAVLTPTTSGEQTAAVGGLTSAVPVSLPEC